LKYGKPVGSSQIAQKSEIQVSPATVRNIMVKLVEEDYLYQPHTSAGRIPTDRGLRFYVNYLFEEASLGKGSLDIPKDDWGISTDSFNKLFITTSKLLSDYSDNMGFVISPRISHLDFKHLRLIKVSEEKVLILLVTTSSLVLNEVVESRHYFTQTELDRASRYINENFGGKSLTYVRDYLVKEIPQYRLKMEDTMAKLTKLLRAYFNQDLNDNQIFLQGASKLLEKSDLFDMKGLNHLFKRFEERTKLAKLLSDVISLDRVKVLIGSELDIPDVCDCSLILSHYGYDHQVLGSLGIIGPKRIPYKQIIPLVDSVAKQLSLTISFK
jgi:heat-inducible transcriptional repressor